VRQAHYAAGDELHASQGRMAEAQLEVSRLEERIRYVVESRSRVEARLIELQVQNQQWQERSEQGQAELETIGEQIAGAEEQSEILAAQAEEQAANLPNSEDAVRAAQAKANDQRGLVVQVQQQIQVLAAESRNIEEQSRALRTRRERLAAERQGLAAPDQERLAELKRSSEAADEARDLAEARLHELQEQLPQLEEQRRTVQQDSNAQLGRQSELSARLEALRALQEKVQTEGKLKPWLAKHGLDGLQGLWTRLHIKQGWENALEAALRERMSALAVGRLETVRAFAQDAPPARLAFYSAPAAAIANTHETLPRLSELLRLEDAGLRALLNDWLEGVYTAESMDLALAHRDKLTHGEVIMTAEGHAVSQFAVSFYAPDSEQAGMLARAQEIEHLVLELRAQTLIAEDAKTQLIRSEAAYSEASQRLVGLRREASETQTRAHQLQVELLRLSQQAEAASSRRSQLEDELFEIDAQAEELQERRITGEARFEELDLQLATTQERHAELDEAVIQAERKLAEAREQLRALERRAQESTFSARALASRRGELQRSIETAQAQVQVNIQSAVTLQQELDTLNDAAAQAGLQEALAIRVEREKELAGVRASYEDLSLRLRKADEQRLEFERSLEPLRERITKLQLEEQAAQLGGAQYMEQLTAAAVDLEALARSVEEGQNGQPVRLYGLQGEIDRINREIAALGAVNLAALDELTSARERKTFLDAQNADLLAAMKTLEDAIHKIDLETRDLLGATFTQVNEHFGRMFPVLFGGGQARLVMTGDEILDAGIQVMAQPPGKKNSTIHLLSGGEKALTAIALVFAIFQLNPAPFCLLDEVDAPLDDANTERYAKLVSEMSAGTQFLFISHNKIAMEMAKQLIGVTMQEQGVSRIVAVDMEAALGMAEAA
jgi:chromosome segregation protein